MVQATHPSEAEAPEQPTSGQPFELSSGYDNTATEYTPRVADEETAELNKVAADLLNTNPNIRQRFTRIFATAGGAAALAFLLAACGPAETTPPPTNTPTSEPSEPTPVETETPEVVPDKYDFNVSEQDIAGYLGETQDAFLARPVEERMLVPLFYAEDMPEFAEDWYSISKNPLDQLPATISEQNSPQEIMTVISYLHRMAETIPRADDDYYLDVNAANKMVAGTFENPLSTTSYSYFTDHIQEQANNGGAVPSARSLAVSNYFTPSLVDLDHTTDLIKEGSDTYRTIRIAQQDGTLFDVTIHWIVAANGTGMWIQGDEVQIQ